MAASGHSMINNDAKFIPHHFFALFASYPKLFRNPAIYKTTIFLYIFERLRRKQKSGGG